MCLRFLIPKGQLIAYEIFKILLNTDGGRTIVSDNVVLTPFEIFGHLVFVTLDYEGQSRDRGTCGQLAADGQSQDPKKK